MRLIQLLLVLVFLGFLPSGCGDCGCDGCGDFTRFTVTELNLKQINPFDGNLIQDTLVYLPADSCILAIGVEKATLAFNEQPEKTTPSFPVFSNTAFACSPPDPNYQRIGKLIIITDKAIKLTNTDSVRAGTDITAYFLASTNLTYFDSVAKVLPATFFADTKGYALFLKPRFTPPKQTTLTFNLLIGLSDGIQQVFSQRELRIK
ncbi:MAG: hypothetical protein EAY81_06865 [Bacteroidetes bacterium]|nr:MAG: hypothetical protein EAY81_06865 [Bacteroidota bacterium]